MRNGKFHDVGGILFDFGGTLDSDGEHWLDRFYALYREAGLTLPREQIKHAFYAAGERCKGNPDLLRAGLRPLVKYHVHLQFEILNLDAAGAEQAMAAAFCSRSEQFLKRNALLLRTIKNGYRLGVVSNFYGNVEVICREAGLAPLLDVIIDSVPLGVEKPDHRIFLAALASLGLPPARVLFVGDSHERDILPAREVGMKTIWMPGPNPRTPLADGSAHARISSLTDLPGVIA